MYCIYIYIFFYIANLNWPFTFILFKRREKNMYSLKGKANISYDAEKQYFLVLLIRTITVYEDFPFI